MIAETLKSARNKCFVVFSCYDMENLDMRSYFFHNARLFSVDS